MKKKSVIIILMILGILFYGLYRTSPDVNTKPMSETQSSKIILHNVHIPKDSTILKYEDGHGGFLGDGEAYSEIQLTKDGAKKFISDAKKTEKWNVLC